MGARSLGIAGVYLVVQDKATTGGATPVAWVASLVALLSITFGTIYQKRFGGGIDGVRACLSSTPRQGFSSRLVRQRLRHESCIGRLDFYSHFAGLSSCCLSVRFGCYIFS